MTTNLCLCTLHKQKNMFHVRLWSTYTENTWHPYHMCTVACCMESLYGTFCLETLLLVEADPWGLLNWNPAPFRIIPKGPDPWWNRIGLHQSLVSSVEQNSAAILSDHSRFESLTLQRCSATWGKNPIFFHQLFAVLEWCLFCVGSGRKHISRRERIACIYIYIRGIYCQ